MEMNTRIQVEHTITEEVYGCDLVKEQIRSPPANKLSPHVQNASCHVLTPLNAAINAEDPRAIFSPQPGRIDFYYAPGGRGVRVDSHAYTGYTVPPYYDSMIAKVIAIGATRDIGDRAHAPRARRVSHRGHQDHDPLSAGDHAQRRLSPRQVRYRLCRPGDELGNLRAFSSNSRLTD